MSWCLGSSTTLVALRHVDQHGADPIQGGFARRPSPASADPAARRRTSGTQPGRFPPADPARTASSDTPRSASLVPTCQITRSGLSVSTSRSRRARLSATVSPPLPRLITSIRSVGNRSRNSCWSGPGRYGRVRRRRRRRCSTSPARRRVAAVARPVRWWSGRGRKTAPDGGRGAAGRRRSDRARNESGQHGSHAQ